MLGKLHWERYSLSCDVSCIPLTLLKNVILFFKVIGGLLIKYGKNTLVTDIADLWQPY